MTYLHSTQYDAYAALPLMVLLVDRQGLIQYANPVACTQLEYSQQQLQQQPITTIMPLFEQHVWQDQCNVIDEQQHPVVSTTLRTAHQTDYQAEIRCSYLASDELYILVGRDISEQEHLFTEHIQREQAATAEANEHARRLTLLSAMSQELNRMQSETALMELGLQYATQMLGFEYAGIGLLRSRLDHITLVAATGPIAGWEPETEIELANSLLGQALAQEQIIKRDQLATQPWSDAQRLAERGMRSMFAAPLVAGTRQVGVLFGSYAREHRLTEADENLLEQITAMLASCLSNLQFFEQMQAALVQTAEYARRQKALNELSKHMNLARTEAEVFQAAAHYTALIVPTDRTSIALLDASGSTFTVIALEGKSGAIPQGTLIPLAGTDIERAISTRQLLVQHNNQDTSLANLPSRMNAPLVTGGNIIGTLNVAHHEAAIYTERDQNLLLQIAPLLAANIESRRLFEQTQQALRETADQAKRLALLSHMGQLMAQAQQETEIFELVTQHMPHIIAADRTSIGLLCDDGVSFEVFALNGNQAILPSGNILPLYGTTAGRAIVEQRIIHTPDLRADPRTSDSSLLEAGLHSSLIAPIKVNDQVIGTLNIAHRQTYAYSQRDENMLQHIAAFLATTIANVRLFAEAQEARTHAEAANEAKSTFLANMSHELRTPLNSIIGFTRIVRRKATDLLPERLLSNLDKVLISAEHLLGLINSILDIAKIEAGRVDIQVAPFAVESMLRTTLTTVQPLIKPAVELRHSIQTELPVVYSDQFRIKQILLNILSNAAKFTETGWIELRAEQVADRLLIAVEDTGIGIAASELEQIFDEFQQVDTSSTRRYSGTGLGLSISRHLAQVLGGDIKAESVLGQGSTFILTLPLQAPVADNNE